MKVQENIIVKHQFENYSLLYLELNNDLPIMEATIIIQNVTQTFIQTFIPSFKTTLKTFSLKFVYYWITSSKKVHLNSKKLETCRT